MDQVFIYFSTLFWSSGQTDGLRSHDKALCYGGRDSCVFGNDCLFPCRCQDEKECTSNMGTCSECIDEFPKPNDQPNRFKWGGNVAYNKGTDQSGVFSGLDSSKGVDGLLGDRSSQSNCAHPDNDNGKAAWFLVDLKSVHQIHNVTVYNTFNSGGSFRMVDFSIRVGNTSDVDEHAECAHYDGEAVVEGGDVTLDCSARGRYVSFRREGNHNDTNLVTICEFVVIGHPLTTEDCPAGRRGPFCLEPCQLGTFGINCSSECGQCKDESCSPVDGHCSDGCQLWFVGDLCKEELCENPYYVSIYSYFGPNPAVPSLDGLTPTLREVNETSVAITWRQDPQIQQEYAKFYGYTVAYAEGNGDLMNDQRFNHDSSTQDQTVIVSNLNAHQEYSFRVECFREMDDQMEYGTPSNIIHIRLTAAKPTPGATSSYDTDSPPGKGENKSALIAGVVVGVAVAMALAVAVAVLLLLRKKKKAKHSEDNDDVPIIHNTKVNEG
ncbi:hypothetical protein CAPTEDRAFT_189356, partial [Capitella teleta]